ncbi:MAG: hypothetical protein H6742_17335 [Alphaproteobacteria bacterium]|nr:hypothetical protein [Alphaproteobacteria bacterium]
MPRARIVGLRAAATPVTDTAPGPVLGAQVAALVDALGPAVGLWCAGPGGLGRHVALAAGMPFDTVPVELAAGGLGGLDALARAFADDTGAVVVCAADVGGEPPIPVPADGLAWRTTLLSRAESDALIARRAGVVPDGLDPEPDAGFGAVALVLAPEQADAPSDGRIAAVARAGVDPALGAGAALDAAQAALASLELASSELSAVATAGLGPGARLALARALDHDPDRLVVPGVDAGAATGLLALSLLLDTLRESGGRLGLLAAGDDLGRGIAVVVDIETWA